MSDATHQTGDEPTRDATISGLIFDAMRAHVTGLIGKVFTEYVDRHRTDKWLLFSDYVLGARNRPNEVIALTVVPGGDYWSRLLRDFKKIAKSDFKSGSTVSSSMIELLSDPRLFSFCWLLEPRRVLTRNVSAVRGMLDRDITV